MSLDCLLSDITEELKKINKNLEKINRRLTFRNNTSYRFEGGSRDINELHQWYFNKWWGKEDKGN